MVARRVRHQGLKPDGRECRHLLFDIVGGNVQLQCACGGLVVFSPGDLRAIAQLIESKTESNWELRIGPGVATR